MPSITDSIGRVLGNRYRLISALGTGASAHVFLAEDVSLQRQVAVKVLQPGLARDESFLKRFRAEARSVASLNHPNILRVFDWGQDADEPYLVLEYLHGGSLRDVLDRDFRLTHAQAARVGAEAAHGLAYAHARGLVHRDIKPANLLFDEEGRVRIADFGVARALAEAAWTEPAGAMIGTARYASPEQAEGRSVDGRADVYSLGLVLYESLTGEVPFVADTTVGTLMARVGATLPRHPALGPLDDVLARATAPDVFDRLDASRTAALLDAAAAALADPTPLPLRIAAPTPTNRADLTAVAATPFDVEQTGRAPAASRAAAPPAWTPPTRKRRRRKWPWVVGAVVVLAAAGTGIALAAANKAFTPSHPTPTLTGDTMAAARQAAAADHFTLSVGTAQRSISVAAGSVISQQPKPGTVLKEGSVIHVVPSAGLPSVAVPSLAGLTCDAATRLLEEAHFKATCPALLAYTTDGKVPEGDIINWSYDNKLNVTTAPYGSTIAVAVSQGKKPVPVPTVAGKTYTQAATAIKAVGLVPSEAQAFSTTVPAGAVIGTTPTIGTDLKLGSTVTVSVSKGPQTVPVPNVTKQTVTKATTAIQAAGLTVGQVYGPPHGKVFTTVPLATTPEPKGTAVNLYTQ